MQAWLDCSCRAISLSYVGMEIQDRLEDENALSPILVTVEVRHTLAILLSSEHESSQSINNDTAAATDSNSEEI